MTGDANPAEAADAEQATIIEEPDKAGDEGVHDK
jgi:hypothetical protein